MKLSTEMMIKLNNLAYMSGVDLLIKELKVNIHQPTLYEISYIGEEKFFEGIKFILAAGDNPENGEVFAILKNGGVSNFNLILGILSQSEEDNEAFLMVLTLFFPDYDIFIDQTDSILLTSRQEKDITVTLNNENFIYFAEVVKDIFSSKVKEEEEIDYHPGSKRAQELVDKIMAGRKKVEEIKEKEQEGERSNLLLTYVSVLCITLHKVPQEILGLTLFAFYDLLTRNNLFQAFNIDIKARLAGADTKEELQNWQKNIH